MDDFAIRPPVDPYVVYIIQSMNPSSGSSVVQPLPVNQIYRPRLFLDSSDSAALTSALAQMETLLL
jgi:hypothetical protein